MVVPGRVISQAQAGSCSDSPGLGRGGLPATHKNKQTDHFAKIIHVGWTHWWYLSQCLGLARWHPGQSPACQVKGFLLPCLCFLLSKWRGVISVSFTLKLQQFSTHPLEPPPGSSLRQLVMPFGSSMQSHLEFSEFYHPEVSRSPCPETVT